MFAKLAIRQQTVPREAACFSEKIMCICVIKNVAWFEERSMNQGGAGGESPNNQTHEPQ